MVQSLKQSTASRILFNSPELLEIQRAGFQHFLKQGIAEELAKKFPIKVKSGDTTLELIFHEQNFKLVAPDDSPRDCILKIKTYSCKLYVQILLIFYNRTKKIAYQTKPEWVLLGHLPMMTKRGHFVINGSPRVIVHQIVRSPGIYFQKLAKKDEKNRARFYGDIIPLKGVWVRLQMTKKGRVEARFKKGKKVQVDFLKKCLELIEFQSLRTQFKMLTSPFDIGTSLAKQALFCSNRCSARSFWPPTARASRQEVVMPMPMPLRGKRGNASKTTFSKTNEQVGPVKALPLKLQNEVLPLVSNDNYIQYLKFVEKRKTSAESKTEHDAFVYTYDKLYRTAEDKDLEVRVKKRKNVHLNNVCTKQSFAPFSATVQKANSNKAQYKAKPDTCFACIKRTHRRSGCKCAFSYPSGTSCLKGNCKGKAFTGSLQNGVLHVMRLPMPLPLPTSMPHALCPFGAKGQWGKGAFTWCLVAAPPSSHKGDGQSGKRAEAGATKHKYGLSAKKQNNAQTKFLRSKQKALGWNSLNLYLGTPKASFYPNKCPSQRRQGTCDAHAPSGQKGQRCLLPRLRSNLIGDWCLVAAPPSSHQVATKELPSSHKGACKAWGTAREQRHGTQRGRSRLADYRPKNRSLRTGVRKDSSSLRTRVKKDNAFKRKKCAENLVLTFKLESRYSLGQLGRDKINTKFGLFKTEKQLSSLDIHAASNWLTKLRRGEKNIDDIDHAQNRRIRTSGELLQTQFENGVDRLKNLLVQKLKEWSLALESSNQPFQLDANFQLFDAKYFVPVFKHSNFNKSTKLNVQGLLPKGCTYKAKRARQALPLRSRPCTCRSLCRSHHEDETGIGNVATTVKASHWWPFGPPHLPCLAQVALPFLPYTNNAKRCVDDIHTKFGVQNKVLSVGAMPPQPGLWGLCALGDWSLLGGYMVATWGLRPQSPITKDHVATKCQFHHLPCVRFATPKMLVAKIRFINRHALAHGDWGLLGSSLVIGDWWRSQHVANMSLPLLRRGITVAPFAPKGHGHYHVATKVHARSASQGQGLPCPLALPWLKKNKLSKTLHLVPEGDQVSAQSKALYKQTSETSLKELFTTKPINGALREFFGSNPLSQYMDQTNPLAELTHKRRLSSLGIGGVSRESAGMAIRGIHATHYGRICPIETPEGKNAGLVNSLAFYTQVDKNGFLKTPYYQVFKGQVQPELGFTFCGAKEEACTNLHIAPNDLQQSWNNILRPNISVSRANELQRTCKSLMWRTKSSVPVRLADNLLDVFKKIDPYQVDCIGISPVQMISVATSLIPFLEHNDANRALMGSNMQRQAVPLMISERPIIGTGLESLVLVESGHITESQVSGFVSYVSAKKIVVESLCTTQKYNPKVQRKKGKSRVLRSRQSVAFCFASDPVPNEVWHGKKGQEGALAPSAQGNFGDEHGHAMQSRMLPCRRCPFCLEGAWASQHQHKVFASPHTFKTVTRAYRNKMHTCKTKFCMHCTGTRCLVPTWALLATWRLHGGYMGATPPITNHQRPCSYQSPSSNKGAQIKKLAKLCPFVRKSSQLIQRIHPLGNFQRSNQNTCITEKPLVRESDWVQKGDILTDCSASENGELAVGKNVLVAYIPWEGYNFEDAIVISERLVKEHIYTSLHIERYIFQAQDLKDGNEWFTRDLPGVTNTQISHLDPSGLPKIGTFLKEGDILAGKIRYLNKKPASSYEKLLCDILGERNFAARNQSLYVPKGVEARVINHRTISFFQSESENKIRPAGAAKTVHIFLGEKRVIQVGDKMSGRHGNKGVISTILPRQDMPYLPDGTPIDLILNPLGVPSRMNVGQVLECLLGLAASYSFQHLKMTAFDELYGVEASQSLVYLKLYQARLQSQQNWLFQVDFPGKVRLIDGRSGECFDQWITVGRAYILKLIHMVTEKIHARGTGPYALITQQPLRGRSNKGGQRLGEMEVWAFEGFGAAYTLQELLTKKSDDFWGRKQIVDSILPYPSSIKDVLKPHLRVEENKRVLGQPEIFKVLLCELQALCLDVGVYTLTSESLQRRFLGVIN
uniref:RNA polymerase beta subunit n=1 Tax=Kalinella pachyderma TaxID=2704665 RepID=UPI0024110460|nr:RNA polymerase beta subunit [Kalinella pachyderma]WDY12869.1 RNA polymerase beta subunit [Kalinella pachyderma]